jgi:superfamily II DNA/RNA helicase
LGVPATLVAELAGRGIISPLPIQVATLPDALAGRDVLGQAQTGSGKTYAFALAALTRLAAGGAARSRRPRCLILVPTRELAMQVETSIVALAGAMSLRTVTVFGGVSPHPQIAALRGGVDVLVACPGRLADHADAGHVSLDSVEMTVLDEADHMADLGFLPIIRRLLDQTPRSGQRLLFSATLDANVDVLVRRYLTNPVRHSVDPPWSPVDAMSHHVLHVSHADRLPVLVDLAGAPGRTLVFARTKRGARRLTRHLLDAGVPTAELHGNLAQTARTRNLRAFAEGRVSTLVATDVAARGIHIDGVALVIHADPPAEPKAYLHRSGRTARNGATGTVVTLMTDDQVDGVREVTRKAGLAPTTTRLRPGHPLLASLASGRRTPLGSAADNPHPAGRRPQGRSPRTRQSPTPPARPGR